jgi:hypothetical protein
MRRVVHAIGFGRDPAHAAGRTAEAMALRDAHARWWDAANVVGLCFAPKVRRGRIEDVALQVHVRRKHRTEKLAAGRRVPPWILAPALGIRTKLWTDVREVGRARLHILASPDRPVQPGFNIGNRRGGSGTLGCVVREQTTGERLGLSCGHVIARNGQAVAGERVLVPSRDEALANGWLRSAPFGEVVAVGQISFAYSDAPTNVDAATVRPYDGSAAIDDAIALLGVAPAGVRSDVEIGTPVKKVGYATELTTGTVQAVHWLISLPYDADDGSVKNAWFADQIGISSFAAEGDSGALVLDDADAAVGLHVGGCDGLSVCMPIQHVLDAVGCTLA